MKLINLRWPLLAALMGLFVYATHWQKQVPVKPDLREELNVSFSPPVQVALSMGDRYLAANMVALRLIVLDVSKLPPAQYQTLATAHQNVGFYNPCHEDNYYVAQAFLPWIGHVTEVKKVLSAAAKCRSWDIMPSFFMGFNAYYFEKQYAEAGDWFLDASKHTKGLQSDQLQVLASKFYEKKDDPTFALKVLKNLRASTKSKQLQEFLDAKIWRQERIVELDALVKSFEKKEKRMPVSLDELVEKHYVNQLPGDPFGQGFTISPTGQVVIKRKP